MKENIIIVNESTRERFKLSGTLEYLYSNDQITRLHIKASEPNLSSFDKEMDNNEAGLRNLGLDTENPSIAYRSYNGDPTEYFQIPKGYGVQIQKEED